MECFDIHTALCSLENLQLAIGDDRMKEKAFMSYYGCGMSSHAQLFQGLKERVALFCLALSLTGAELCFWDNQGNLSDQAVKTKRSRKQFKTSTEDRGPIYHSSI